MATKTILDAHEAAKRVFGRMPIGQSITFDRERVPVERFGEFVRECKGFGLCVMDYRIDRHVTLLKV